MYVNLLYFTLGNRFPNLLKYTPANAKIIIFFHKHLSAFKIKLL